MFYIFFWGGSYSAIALLILLIILVTIACCYGCIYCIRQKYKANAKKDKVYTKFYENI